MPSTFIGMGVTKNSQNLQSLSKENAKLIKANEKLEKEKIAIQEELEKANEKIAELEAKSVK